MINCSINFVFFVLRYCRLALFLIYMIIETVNIVLYLYRKQENRENYTVETIGDDIKRASVKDAAICEVFEI